MFAMPRKPAFFRYSLPGRREICEEAGRALLAHFGCGAVLITRGEKGMSLIEETASRPLHLPQLVLK